MSAPSRSEDAWRRVPLGIALALLVLGASICPPASAHSPRHYFLDAYRAIRFKVHGSHGYVITVAQGPRGYFWVTVRRGSTSTEYVRRALRSRPAPRSEVHGQLGKLGRFDVHFTPRGKPQRLPRYRGCRGPGPTIQPGIVRGEIRFQGERGYTRAIAHQATAELETLPAQRCHDVKAGHSKHPPRYTATLRVSNEGRASGVLFEALRFAPGSRPPAQRVFYKATDYERLGSVFVTRRVRLAARTSTFLLPNFAVAPETAVIQPPAPFTGSATFARTPESTFSWTGDLAVSFPGLDPVALTGPAFRFGYCALRSCVSQESSEERERLPY
jgi:hypothetical protein